MPRRPKDGVIDNRRTACDRCRRHKLRCEQGTSSRCRRCEGAKAVCVTGPALKSGRPAQGEKSLPSELSLETSIQSTSEAMSSHMGILSSAPFHTPPFDADAAGSQPQHPISLSNMDDFNEFWAENFEQPVFQSYVYQQTVDTPPTETSVGPLKKLSDLQANLLLDLDLAKASKTADQCSSMQSSSISMNGENFMIGRLLDQSTALIEILDYLQFSATDMRPPRLECDTPTFCALASCYVSLTRVYRTILSSILDSLPSLMAVEGTAPQLFPGMNLGGFTLEARLDLQVQILVQTTENMIAKIESKFGLTDNQCSSPDHLPTEQKTTQILRMMLADEASEQPPLLEPRGECKSLKEILVLLKQATSGGHI